MTNYATGVISPVYFRAPVTLPRSTDHRAEYSAPAMGLRKSTMLTDESMYDP